MDASDIPSLVALLASSAFVVAAGNRWYSTWKQDRKILRARLLILWADGERKTDVIYPISGSWHALSHFNGRNLFLRRSDLTTLQPTANYVTIGSIYELPNLHGLFQQQDHIVLARNGDTLRFTHDTVLRAWRTTKPLTENFV